MMTVLDHDTLRTDDFEGEAFLALKAIPGVAGESEGDGLSSQPDAIPAQIRLPLMHPKPNGMIRQRVQTNEAGFHLINLLTKGVQGKRMTRFGPYLTPDAR